MYLLGAKTMDTAHISEPAASEPDPASVVRLYDTILLHIGRAGEATRKGDYQTQFDEVMKATRIIDGLNRHLDMEKGGDVAVNLRDMYQSVSRALLRSVGKDSASDACDRLVDGLKGTRNAWAEISGMKLI
jgi:flagellar protein FliS